MTVQRQHTPSQSLAQPTLLLPTYPRAPGGKAAKLLNNSVTHLELSSLTFTYAV